VFVPRREHAQFCSVRCRVAWNRKGMGDAAVEASALRWSITAMSDMTAGLSQVRASDRPRAFAAIDETVWGVTIVDAAMVRDHIGVYDAVLAEQAPAERRAIEETLAGLRFVRNRIGHGVDLPEFVESDRPGEGKALLTGWTWKSVPRPALASLPPRARAWETTRYEAYQAQLAGHTIGEIFERATAFLNLTAAKAASIRDNSGHAAP
jgi:hypothetical protein